MSDVKFCECRDGTGPADCRMQALWRVAVGTRRSDAQLACGRHLNRTCWALAGAEGRSRVALTVTPLTYGASGEDS